MSERERSGGSRLQRALLSALGWIATALGVLVIVVLVGGGFGWVSELGGGIVLVGVAVMALLPTAIGAAYVLVRRRNRAREARATTASTPVPAFSDLDLADGMPAPAPPAPRRSPAASAARSLESGLASLIDGLGDPTPDSRLQRLMLADRLRISAATLAELDDRGDALGFLWFARPSQPDDFTRSSDFAGLPLWAQDAVVLLDLRRELQLRGAAALDDGPGFYRHPFPRLREASVRSGSADLDEALVSARRSHDPADVQRLRGALDDAETWMGLLGIDGAD